MKKGLICLYEIQPYKILSLRKQNSSLMYCIQNIYIMKCNGCKTKDNFNQFLFYSLTLRQWCKESFQSQGFLTGLCTKELKMIINKYNIHAKSPANTISKAKLTQTYLSSKIGCADIYRSAEEGKLEKNVFKFHTDSLVNSSSKSCPLFELME